MGVKIELRPVVSGDKQRWRELMLAYAAFYEVEVSDEGLAATWGWIEDEKENFWCTLASDSTGQVIGFTQYQLMHRSLSGSLVCYLSDLYVQPDTRGGGVGRALIDHVFEFARSNNVSNVRWLTQDFNAAARKLYDTYGEKSDFILYSFPV